MSDKKLVPNDVLLGVPIRRIVHIADGQETKEYVPAEDYDRAVSVIGILLSKSLKE